MSCGPDICLLVVLTKLYWSTMIDASRMAVNCAVCYKLSEHVATLRTEWFSVEGKLRVVSLYCDYYVFCSTVITVDKQHLDII